MSDHPPKSPGLRDRKKAASRQMISNVATLLFLERGFENVSVDEIAAEAAVSRKTVFNYFARKEDLIFDREQEVRDMVRQAIVDRGKHAPIEAVQDCVRALVEQKHPLFRISERPVAFWHAVAQSTALTTRARELQGSLADDLASHLSEAVGRSPSDAEARLAATLLMGVLVVAYEEALRAFSEGRAPESAFLSVIDRGFEGVNAALAGTSYIG